MAHVLWFTHPNTGLVEVDGAIPTLEGASARLFESGVRRWEKLACQAAREFQVPVHWILGMIFAESGGVRTARSPAGALGLMQLLSPGARGGLTDDELLDAGTNIRAGARFIAIIYRDGDQLPEIASKYNAGSEPSGAPHPSERSPWKIREEPGHIDRVVAAANYAAETLTACTTEALPERQLAPRGPLRPSSPSSPSSPAPSSSSSSAGAAFGAVALGWLAWELWGKRGRRRGRARA